MIVLTLERNQGRGEKWRNHEVSLPSVTENWVLLFFSLCSGVRPKEWITQCNSPNIDCHTNFIYLFGIILFFPAVLRCVWQIKIICLLCKTWCFDMCIYYKVFTTIKLINISVTSHSCQYFFLIKIIKTYSPRKFWVYNTVLLTMVSMLYVRSP